MRFIELTKVLADHQREYTLSSRVSVMLDFRVPIPLSTRPFEIKYAFVSCDLKWLQHDDLHPADLVALADVVGMVNKWVCGDIPELLPSTSTLAAQYRARYSSGCDD